MLGYALLCTCVILRMSVMWPINIILFSYVCVYGCLYVRYVCSFCMCKCYFCMYDMYAMRLRVAYACYVLCKYVCMCMFCFICTRACMYGCLLGCDMYVMRARYDGCVLLCFVFRIVLCVLCVCVMY